jgi:hypothetical protein
MTERPLLILDVDGVLLPLTRDSSAPAPSGFRAARAWSFDVLVPVHLPSALGEFAASFELVWCSDWEHAANREVAPLFGLPELPTLTRGRGRGGGWWKLDAVREYAGERPLVWADDQMSSTARRWATERNASTLLLRPHRERGLSARQMALIAGFARRLGA